MDRKCKNNHERSCYICGDLVLPNCQAKITDFVKKVYRDYFGVKVEDRMNHSLPTFAVKRVKNLRN